MTLVASSHSIARTTTVLTGALLSLFGYGCQTGSSSQAGLISVDTCEECAPAYDECRNGGGDDCEPMMQECFSECAPPTPTDPGDCSCHDLFDECMGQQPTPPDCEDRPDGSGCDQSTDDKDDKDDDGTSGNRWECEAIYQQCADACDEPTPPGQCEQCEGILGDCFERAKDSDDPVSVLGECLTPYVQCEVECQTGDDSGDQDPGTGECDRCGDELQSCLGDAEGNDDPDNVEACFERNEECVSECAPTPDPGNDPGDDENGCWESFAGCVEQCGDGTTREGCERDLEDCLQP